MCVHARACICVCVLTVVILEMAVSTGVCCVCCDRICVCALQRNFGYVLMFNEDF